MRVDREKIGLCVIDVQEKLFPKIEGHQDILKEIERMIQAFEILKLPIVVTEQYPEGLGPTLKPLRGYPTFSKTTFSAFSLLEKREQWALVGIEAHVCVLQTALDLVEGGSEVVVPRGAIGSRRRGDCAVASDEMRHSGVRITALESLLFELLKDSKASEFKAISKLVK